MPAIVQEIAILLVTLLLAYFGAGPYSIDNRKAGFASPE